MKLVISLVFASVALCQEPANLLEFRGSSTQYRYADWMHTSGTKLAGSPLVTDLYYVGGKGYNEANAGVGLLVKLGKTVTLIPAVYATAGTKAPQSGAKFGLVGSVEYKAWKGNLYLAQFCRIGNRTPNYLILDSGDVTRKIAKGFEGGISTGFLKQSCRWNPQYGPMVKFRDWSVSYRFGAGGREFRIGRVFVF